MLKTALWSSLDRQRFRDEHGNVLIIVISSTVLLITVLISLGIEGAQLRRHSQRLTLFADETCRRAARRIVPQRNALLSFQNDVVTAEDPAQDLLPGIELIRARITIPSAPNSDCYVGGNCEMPYAAANSTNYNAQTGIKFAAVTNIVPPSSGPVGFGGPTFPSCSLSTTPCLENSDITQCDGDCMFRAQVQASSGGSLVPIGGLPNELLTDIDNMGSAVMCEFIGVVDQFLGGAREISAKAVWVSRVNGKFDSANDAGMKRGVTIAVAPQMTTDAGKPEFRFLPDGGYSDTFLEQHDPLYEYRGAVGSPNQLDGYQLPQFSTIAGYEDCRPASSPIVDQFVQPLPPDPINRHGTVLRSTASTTGARDQYDSCNANPDDRCEQCPDDIGTFAPNGCLQISDREELYVASMNPAIAVRNTISSALLELFSRTNTRDTTEFLVVAPQHRTNPVGGITGYLGSPNSPRLVVPAGEDIALADYQVPFIGYDSGNTSIPGGFSAHKSGRIDPWISGACNPSLLQRHHSLVAGQLRYPTHLYSSNTAMSIEDTNTPEQSIQRLQKTGVSNTNFEFTNTTNAERPFYSFINALRQGPYPLVAGTNVERVWDTKCPWKEPWKGSYSCETAEQGVASRRLTAAEVAAAMGSIQSCPYEQAGFSGELGLDGITPISICEKPDVPSDDLRPDLAGLLYYLAGTEVTPVGCTPMGAVNPPGIFPLSGTQPCAPYGPARYTERQRERQHVVYITHLPISTGERALLTGALQPVIQNNTFTVIYIPTASESATTQAVQDYRDVFIDTNDTSRQANLLIVLSPFDYDRASTGGAEVPSSPLNFNANGVTHTPSQMFSIYWEFLLTDPDFNVRNLANRLFYNRIFEPRIVM